MSYIGNSPTFLLKGSKAVFEYTATAGQTVFTGGDDNSAVLKALDDTIGVFSNGVRLVLTDDYTLNTAGDTITLTSAAALNDIIVIETFDEIANLGTYTKAEADARYINTSGDITTGTIQVSGTGNNIELGDNNKVTFGDGDLEIYHDGSNSYIDDAGQGSLFLRSGTTYIQNAAGTKTSIVTNAGAGQTLYHNNTPVFVTTATGIDVTGNVVASGTVDGRDVATDGTKLDTVETSADVTDTANVTAAGALMTTGGTISELDLAAIAKDISDTAVDVFIYDTRKDSDGGAWRKRTQHTSWYNETLNTATRGSRKEFPAVAVITLHSGAITIYDGDDPDMPMWMKFTQSSGQSFTNGGQASYVVGGCGFATTTGINMLNGTLAVPHHGGCSANDIREGLLVLNFLSEVGEWITYTTSANFEFAGPISNRNTSMPLSLKGSTRSIVNTQVNDVAMTVLPNAPIDAATGLPVPTIAVATAGGTSVIKDDGTVVDVMTSNSYGVAFTKNYELVHTVNDASSTFTNHIREIPSADTTTTAARRYFRAGNNTGSIPSISATSGEPTANILATLPNNTLAVASNGTQSALNILQEVPNAPTTGMIAYVASDYNTGWMNGDIKLATLSDTDDTNITFADKQLIDEPYFNTSTGWYFNGATGPNGAASTTGSGWTLSGGKITMSNGGGDVYAVIPVVNGVQYVMQLTFDTTGNSAVTSNVSWGFRSLANSGYISESQNQTILADNTAGQTKQIFWTANTTGNVLARCYCDENLSIDNWTVHIAEEDRSVNGKGLQVFGTVTKTAVATGAELMAYSGFSSSNYLRQPYNSDLDFGTGSYSVMGWFKTDATNSTGYIASLGTSDNDESLTVYITRSNYGIYFDYGLSNQYSRLTQTSDRELVTDTNWHHFVCHVSAGAPPKIYVDGINKEVTVNGNAPSTFTFNTGYILNIGNGRGLDNSGPFGGSIALLRISTTVPSPEQIKKIYEDEKFLFQENAKATLYGSSDAVTALAYDDDTELLHVGTSAGRSVFQGLRRIDNTTDAVGAAISASNGMVAED